MNISEGVRELVEKWRKIAEEDRAMITDEEDSANDAALGRWAARTRDADELAALLATLEAPAAPAEAEKRADLVRPAKPIGAALAHGGIEWFEEVAEGTLLFTHMWTEEEIEQAKQRARQIKWPLLLPPSQPQRQHRLSVMEI